MRILYVQPSELMGGAERQALMNITRLQRLGVEVVPLIGPKTVLVKALEQEGVHNSIVAPRLFHPTHIGVSGVRASIDIALSCIRSVRDFWSTERQIAELCRIHKIDAIIASRAYAWVVATRPARKLGVPIVWRAGGCLRSKNEALGLNWFSRLWAPDYVVYNSAAVQSSFAPHLDCPNRIIRNCVDTTRFDGARVPAKVREELGFDESTPVLAIAARPRPLKNFEMLAVVLQRVAERIPNVQLLIAGDTEERPAWAGHGWRQFYEKLFADMGLGPRTHFLGQRDDIEHVYASCDVALLTSHHEGAPNAVLEAMAMGKPVVATDVPGVSEIVEHGVQGFLAPPNDADAFAEHVIALLESAELRRRIGAAGRATVHKHYGDQTNVRELAELLAQLVRETESRPAVGIAA
jgi:glycosyltransferase involved in cell wall biosynthesis